MRAACGRAGRAASGRRCTPAAESAESLRRPSWRRIVQRSAYRSRAAFSRSTRARPRRARRRRPTRRPARGASNPSAPVPANGSSTRAPPTSPRIEKSASRTRSGRRPRAPSRRRRQPCTLPFPRHDPHPHTVLTPARASPPRRRMCAAWRSRRLPRSPIRGRIRPEQRRRILASLRRLPAVAGQAGVAQIGDPALPRRQHRPLSAQLQVDLGQLEAVRSCAPSHPGGRGHRR